MFGHKQMLMGHLRQTFATLVIGIVVLSTSGMVVCWSETGEVTFEPGVAGKCLDSAAEHSHDHASHEINEIGADIAHGHDCVDGSVVSQRHGDDRIEIPAPQLQFFWLHALNARAKPANGARLFSELYLRARSPVPLPLLRTVILLS